MLKSPSPQRQPPSCRHKRPPNTKTTKLLSKSKSRPIRTATRSKFTTRKEILHDTPIEKEKFADHPVPQFIAWFADVISVNPTMPECMTISTIKKLNNGALIPSSRPVLMKAIISNDQIISSYGMMSAANLEKFPTLQTTARFPTKTDPNVLTTSTNTPFDSHITKELLSTGGFTFVTNYHSNKGLQAEDNPYVSLTFHWVELERVVRIEGQMHKVPESLSDYYHNERPRSSRISALTSLQSRPVTSHEDLEYRYDLLDTLLEKEEYSRLLDPNDPLVYCDVTENAVIRPDGVSAAEFVPRPTHWGGYVIIPHEMEFWQGRPSRFHERVVYTRTGDVNDGFKWDMTYLSP